MTRGTAGILGLLYTTAPQEEKREWKNCKFIEKKSDWKIKYPNVLCLLLSPSAVDLHLFLAEQDPAAFLNADTDSDPDAILNRIRI